jgi:predicted  nucleic acid-binding Zn-ribbon protein
MQIQEHPFQSFIDLITLDQEIVATEQSLLAIDNEIAALIAQEKTVHAELEAQKKKMLDARKAVDALELELKTLDGQEKQKKDRLDNVVDHKQYQSLKNEIDAIKNKQHLLEDRLMQDWNVLEVAQKEYTLIEKDHPDKVAAIQQQISQKNDAIAELEKQLEHKIEQRPVKEQLVPSEWIEKYGMMRARVSDPVVSVQRGACSACFSTLTEQDLLLVRRRKMLQCKSCFRLLYSQELEKEGEKGS